MVLLQAGLFNFFLEIGVVTAVQNRDTVFLCHFPVGISVQHVDVLVGMGDAETSAVIHPGLSGDTFLGCDVDDSGRSPGTVLSRFGGILQDGEGFNIGRIDGGQQGKVSQYSVHDNQRFVSAGQGSGTAHSHGFQSCRPVVAFLDGQSGHSSLDSLQRIRNLFLVHLFFRNLFYQTGEVLEVSYGIAYVDNRVFRDFCFCRTVLREYWQKARQGQCAT